MKNLLGYKRNTRLLVWLFPFVMGAMCCACDRNSIETFEKAGELGATTDNKESIAAAQSTTTTPYIAIGNVGLKQLEVYNYASAVWDANTRLDVFKPTTSLGFSSVGIAASNGRDFPVDMKVHFTAGFSSVISAIATVGHRWVGVAKHQDAAGNNVAHTKLWETWFSAAEDPNIHAVELLANGNVAVAGTGGYNNNGKGNWVRLYNTSNPNVTNSFAEISVTAPHCLLWDPANNILWVGGVWGNMHGVKAYTIGTRTNPQLIEVPTRTRVKQWPALKWPHDIQPFFGNPNKFYYADHTGLYIFDKTAPDAASAFTPAPGASNRPFLKSVGNQAVTGYTIETLADPANCGTYCTKKVDFYGQITGNYGLSRTISSGSIYRARIWTRPYQ